MAYNAEYFVARNIADYKTSEVWAIWPREAVKNLVSTGKKSLLI